MKSNCRRVSGVLTPGHDSWNRWKETLTEGFLDGGNRSEYWPPFQAAALRQRTVSHQVQTIRGFVGGTSSKTLNS